MQQSRTGTAIVATLLVVAIAGVGYAIYRLYKAGKLPGTAATGTTPTVTKAESVVASPKGIEQITEVLRNQPVDATPTVTDPARLVNLFNTLKEDEVLMITNKPITAESLGGLSTSGTSTTSLLKGITVKLN